MSQELSFFRLWMVLGVCLAGDLWSTPAAISVITADDIRSSGYTSVPEVLSCDAGYRALAGAPLFVDLSVFVNERRGLAGFSRLPPRVVTSPGPLRAVVRFPYINAVDGTSRGLERAPEWQAVARLRVSGSYAFRRIALEARPENMDAAAVDRYEGSSPAHLARVQARLDLPRRVELDAAYRYVSALEFAHDPGPPVGITRRASVQVDSHTTNR